MRYPLLVAATTLLAACQAAESPRLASIRMSMESAAVQTAIDAVNIRYARYMNGNMADSVASLFVETGVMMPPNMPIVVGRAAIQKFLTDSPMPPGATITFAAEDVRANGPMAVERGRYVFDFPANGKAPAFSIPGKYLVHWQNVNGWWLQVSSAWSDDAPMTLPTVTK